MQQELVVIREIVGFNTDNRPVVCHPDEQIAAVGIQEGRHGFQGRMLNGGVFLLLADVPAKGAFEFDLVVFPLGDQFGDHRHLFSGSFKEIQIFHGLQRLFVAGAHALVTGKILLDCHRGQGILRWGDF